MQLSVPQKNVEYRMSASPDSASLNARVKNLAAELRAALGQLEGEALDTDTVAATHALCSEISERINAQNIDAHPSEADPTLRALQDSNSRFQVLTDAMPQMVWSTMPDGQHDYFNARWYEFTGVPAGFTDGEGWAEVFHPDDQASAKAAWSRSLETGAPYQIEYRLRHHTGLYRWVLGRALPVKDVSGQIRRWIGTCTDIDDARQAAERNELLGQELSHRIKNIFAIITGLTGLSARRAPQCREFVDELQARIAALGRAHEFVRPQVSRAQIGPEGSTLKALLAALFAPYTDIDARFQVTGDDVFVDDKGVTPLALIFHELATNSAKYGALSVDTGIVEIAIRRDGPVLTITWIECGGPLIASPPGHEGFGSRLTSLSAERQLGGTITRRWEPAGLVVTVSLPCSALAHG